MMRLPPYAEFLQVRLQPGPDGEMLLVMPFGDQVLGRPGFLHGGAIAGLLELASFAALRGRISEEEAPVVKPINFTVNFMRGGIDHETFASAVVTRLGNRVANVEAHAWQQDRDRPIAGGQMNVLIRRRDPAGCRPEAADGDAQ